MRHIRRIIHVLAWIGTIAVSLVALALIASQTPWFRDYLRRVIVREAKQYLDGELTIGRLGGNLFFGVTLSDVVVDVSGERVIAIKGLEVDYSVFHLVSKGIVLDRIALTSPAIHMARDARGWNFSRLVKKQRQEADRRGPGRPVTLASIEIAGGTVTVDDQVGSTVYRVPRRLEALDLKASFEYEPVHYSVKLARLNFRGGDPDLLVHELTGNFAVREDNFYLEAMTLKTPETALAFEGVVQQYLRRPVIKVTTSGRVSLPEIGRILLAVAGYELHPELTLKTDGTIDSLEMDLDVRSEAGLARGQVAADFQTPDLRFTGPLHVERFDLGPIFKNPKQRTDITGDAKFDIVIRSAPEGAPALDRLKGTFAFRGPHVRAFDYEAAAVNASGRVDGPRITLAHTRVNAYGAAATTRGVIVLAQGKRPLAYDLQGTASRLDVKKLPAFLRAPRLDTDIDLPNYHVTGSGRSASGTATLGSSRIEGADIADRTLVGFEVAPGRLVYSARGAASGLDLPRLGRALGVKALDRPLYEGRVNGAFDVKGSGTTVERMTLDATGTLSDTILGGTELPEMAYTTRIAGNALTVQAKGEFEHLNPAVIVDRERLDGNVNGHVDATFTIPDLAAPFSPASFGVDGSVSVRPSLLGGVQIAGAEIAGRYEKEVADLKRVQIKGPDVILEASGRLALDRTSESNLTYHIDSGSLTELGKIAGQTGVEGAILLDGKISGNAASLETTGTMSGIGLGWNGQRVLGAKSSYEVDVPDLEFAKARVEAATTAEFVQAAGVELNHVSAKTTYAGNRLEFSTTFKEQTREIETTGNVVFHPDHQEIHLPQFAVRADKIEWRMGPGGEATIQYRADRIDFKNVTLTSGDQSISVDGMLSKARDSRQPLAGSLQVQAKNVDLAQAERLLLQNRGLAGRLTANAKISGTTEQPIVDGHFEVTDGRFQNYAYQSLVADVDYTGRKFTLDAALQQAPGVAITAKGVVPMSAFARDGRGEHVAPTADDAFDVRIQTASLNLGVIQGFTTAVTNVGGTLQADVHLTGAGRDPHFGGFIEIRDGGFAVPRGGTSYTGLDTRIDLEQDVVRIRRFEMLDENGEQLAVAGQLAVHERQVGAVDMTLESQNFEAIDNELGDVGVGTRLTITGQLTRPRLEGEVRIAAGRLELDRILQLFYDPYRTDVLPEVVSAERVAQTAGSAEEATRQALGKAAQGATPAAAPAGFDEDYYAPPKRGTFYDNVALDVHLRIPDNLVVRGRKLRPGGPTGTAIGDMNITFGGDLTIRKNYDQPLTIAGTVNTVRGTYQFQGRQFEIERDGTLRFTGDPSDPIVDLTAVRRIPDTGVEARVHITGNASRPELQLSSTPPLDESDVLALIVFNRPINELGTGERASLAATAGGIATGFLATPLGESIGRALDLDLFEITTSAEGDSLGAGVTLGEQIGDRTFLKLRQQFGERTYSEFLVEYQISDFLRFVGAAAPETSGAANRIGQRRIERVGIDLIFFFSY